MHSAAFIVTLQSMQSQMEHKIHKIVPEDPTKHPINVTSPGVPLASPVGENAVSFS